jgi:hypothetical protein
MPCDLLRLNILLRDGDIMNDVILQDKDIQKMDQKKIMKDGNGKTKNEIVPVSNPTTNNDDDFDEDEDDGNEWDE